MLQPTWLGLRMRGIVVLGLAVAVMAGASAAAGQDFRFSLSADMRQYSGQGTYDTSDYFRGACEAIDALGGGAFMVTPGDLDPPENVYWTLQTVLGPGYLWYPVVGNHEEETSSDMAWLRAFNLDGDTLPYIVNLGPSATEETTYSFDYGDAHFVQINEYYDGLSDTGTDGDVVDDLYDWLEADLIATTQPLIFVTGHEPAWPQPDADNGRMRHRGDSLDAHPSHRDRFWSLLREHQVTAYLCGHTHNFSAVNIDGVWQLDVGHARGLGDTGAMSTFVLTDVVGDTVTYEAYRGSGVGGAYFPMHSEMIACERCETYLFQDDVFPDASYSGTTDTCIESASVHGGDTPLIVDGDPDSSAILEWDVSAIPTGSTILRAWITVNVQNTSADTYAVYEMKRDWVEDEASWIDYADGGSWQTAGASGADDRGATDLGLVSARYDESYIMSLNGEGIALVQSWIDSPAFNRGVIITDYAKSDSVRFDSRESVTAEHRPKLTVYVMTSPAPAIDIKPWSDTNAIKPFARGVIPVAILGSERFDVADVDVTTLGFGPAGASPIFDLAHPLVYWLAHRDVNHDGEMDLLSYYPTPDTGIALGDTQACLTGETVDGTPFEGCDAIETVMGCGHGYELAFLVPPLIWMRRRRGCRSR